MVLAGGFLRFERRFRLPALGVERHHVALLRPGFRIYLVETRGISMDSRATLRPPCLRPRSATVHRPAGQLTIPLDGAFVVRRRQREQVFADHRAAADAVEVWDERWDGEHFRVLVVEWDVRHGSPLTQLDELRLTTAEREFVLDLAAHFDRDELDDVRLHAAIDRLRAMGLPLVHPEAMPAFTVPPSGAAIVAAAGRLLGRLDQGPAIQDLCADAAMDERQLRRRWRALAPWMVMQGSWRELLNDTRLAMAASLSTARGATLEVMTAALGYRAPSAMLAAMRVGGLPAPSQIRALVRGSAMT